MNSWLLLILAFGLVLLNGFFVTAEFALIKIRSSRLDMYAQGTGRRARMTEHVTEHLETYLSATHFGISLASLGLGWIGAPAFAPFLEYALRQIGLSSPAITSYIALSLTFTIIIFLHMVLGVIAPKALAVRIPEGAALWLSPPLAVFYRLFFPVIWLLNTSARILLRLLGIDSASAAEGVRSTEEVRVILAESPRSVVLSKDEKELVENVFEMAERTTRQIMVPRSDIAFLSTSDTMERTLQIAHQYRYTRYPLCEEDLDHVVGMVHIKELFVIVQGGLKVSDVGSIKRDVLFVPETASVKSLLNEFQNKHIQMAIIIDEYGGTVGLVTLEDVLEEIVGDIQDELDTPDPPKFRKIADRGYLVQAGALLEEVNRELGTAIEDTENDTIGGHVVTRLGRLAQPGDTVVVGSYDVFVRDVEGRRVQTLEFIPSPGPVIEEEEDGIE